MLVQRSITGDLLSKRRLEIEISFRFILSLFLIPLAQRQEISSDDFGETNMFDCFRGIAPSSAGLANDVIPFLSRNANEPCERDKSTSRDFVARSSASRTKNHASLPTTFTPGILVRST